MVLAPHDFASITTAFQLLFELKNWLNDNIGRKGTSK
jgi:hypothetical protein